MNELHERFEAWIASGAHDDPPRGVALHASGCDACLGLAAAFDALLAIDTGLAPPPPVRAAPLSPLARGSMRLARSAAAAISVMLVIGAGAIVGANALRPRTTDSVAQAPATEAPTPRVAEGVLGAAGGPTTGASPAVGGGASPSTEASATPRPTATPRPVAGAPTPNPTMGGGPPPASALPATPVPTAAPVTTAPSIAPTASSTPTPTPTPVPTPSPVPTPEPTAVPAPTPSPTDPSPAP